MDATAKHAAFVRGQTRIAPVPLVPEIRIHTATELTPVWENFLSEHALGLPYWCVPWAGGQALARWVLDHPEAVRGRRVLDFGTGSGLVAIAAAKAGARVHAVDIDPFALVAASLNAELNEVELSTECADLSGRGAVDVEVVLAGDVWYEREPAHRFARWFRTLNARVVTGDPGRAYVPTDAIELGRYEVPTSLDVEAKTSLTTRVLGL
jgi:predicted nicotinamide N-methyase